MRAQARPIIGSALRPVGDFTVRVMRRHVDLVRVGSALCQAANSR